jgi:hypothetical protein
MDELITEIIKVCIIPLLGVLTGFLVKWINAKSQEIQSNIDNTTLSKYMTMLTNTVTDCVIATNQTYVDSIKESNNFDEAAQQEAFRQTLNAVLNILNDDAKEYLSAAVGDLETLITNIIEATVKKEKTDK